MKNKFLYFGFLVLALLGIWWLVGLWVPPGFTIAGHDSGLALNAKDFLFSRFFSWWPHDFGQDNSPHFGSLILHSIDYLSSFLAKVSYSGNRINFFFWIALIFSTSFLFAYKFKEKLGKYSPILFPVFLTVNFFIIQSLFILERAKYSVLIASILILLITVKVMEQSLEPLLASVVSALILFIFNCGSWLGLPLYGSFLVLVFVIFLNQFLWDLKERNFSGFLRLLVYFFLTFVGFVILNSYSIFPYLITFIKQDAANLISGGADLGKSWMVFLSQASSYLNFFRLQGVPDWYASPNDINLAHSFSNEYLTNKWLIISSFIFPLIAFCSFFLARDKKEKKLISLFGLSVLVAMFFMAGSHTPLGFLFEFIFDKVPGFAIFRSPYYKFASTFFIGFSGLMAFTLSKITEKIEIKWRLEKFGAGFLISLLIIGIWFSYYYVIFQPGKIFSWQKGYTTRVKIPSYVYDFSNFSKQYNFEGKRTVLLPPFNSSWSNDAYSWGYWSLADLPSATVNQEFLVNDSVLTNIEKGWLNKLYEVIKNGDEKEFFSLATRLQVGSFLLRNDVLADNSWSATEDPLIYKNLLEKFPEIQKVADFGPWSFYKIKNLPEQKITTISNLAAIPQNEPYLAWDFLHGESTIIQDSAVNLNLLNDFVDQKLTVFTCQSCLVESNFLTELPKITITPDSKIYFLKEAREEETLKNARTTEEKDSAFLGFTLRRVSEEMTMLNFNRPEKYLVENLKTINNYLEQYFNNLQQISTPQNDFANAKKTLDFLTPVNSALSSYAQTDKFSQKSITFRESMLDVLWNIHQIENFYNSIILDPLKWEKEKVYFVNFSKVSDYHFSISTSLLPIGQSGLPIFPSQIIYKSTWGQRVLEFQKEKDFLSFIIQPEKTESGEINLLFDNLPNLFEDTSLSQEYFPEGQKTCLTGKISSFRSNSSYRIIIKTPKINYGLSLYLSGNDSIFLTNQFFNSEQKFGLDPKLSYQPHSFIFSPKPDSQSSFLYLCSETGEIPQVNSIEVYEIVMPTLILSENLPVNLKSGPRISYQKISSVKYEVNIEGATFPYLLLFNEQFSPFWKITKEGGNIPNNYHFSIDGYANAWKISENGSYKLIIEYSNQKLFYFGIVVTLFSLSGVLIYLLIVIRKKKK